MMASDPTVIYYRIDNLTLLREHLHFWKREVREGEGACILIDEGLVPSGPLQALAGEFAVGVEKASSLLGTLNTCLSRIPGDALLVDAGARPLAPDWSARLQETALSDGPAISGPRLRGRDGHLLLAGFYGSWGGAVWPIGEGEEDIGQYSRINRVAALPLTCLYLPAHVLRTVGPLQEGLAPDEAAVDFCRRASRQGFEIRCDGRVTLMATHSLELGDLPRLLEREAGHLSVAWRSLMDPVTGYGFSSRQLVLALDRMGVAVTYRYSREDRERSEVHPLLQDIIRRPWRDGTGVEVVYDIAPHFSMNTGRRRIGYTMLEVDGVPADWVRAANSMDELWVPSQFNRATFQAAGVQVPIEVMPLGVDPHYFHPGISSFRLDPDLYTFLSVFEWSDRKAPEILLKAFNDEFSNDEPVLLLIHTRATGKEEQLQEQVRSLRLRPRAPILLLLNINVPTYQLGCLYRSADCFVLPTRGEGWGLPLLEAMACGLPVIATDWGAHRDFFNTSNGYPLAVEGLVPAQTAVSVHVSTYPGFRWAQPSYEHLRALLRRVYENRREAIEIGGRAAAEAAERWSWDRAAAKIKKRLEDLQQN